MIPRFCRAGLGLNVLFWSGDFSENCPQFLSEFFQRIFSEFSALFLQGFRPSPHPPKFTPKIVGIPLKFTFFNPKCFHADFLLMGVTNRFYFSVRKEHAPKSSQEENPPRNKSTQTKKVISTSFICTTSVGLPDSCHREEGKSSCELLEKFM